MTYVKIGDLMIPAAISGKTVDKEWDGRASKTISCEMSYEQAKELFVDDLEWSIIHQAPDYEVEVRDEEGNVTGTEMVTPEPVEYDNSEYCVAGAITDYRDGRIDVKMGKLTDLEEICALMYGGEL